jgi:hypothetical protein
MRLKTTCPLLIVLLFLFSCGGTKTPEKKEGKEIEITKSDAGKKIPVDQNTTVKLKLNQCIGCDPSKYAWQIVKIDSVAIALTGTAFKSKACEGCDGGNGDVTYTFLMKEKGSPELTIAILNDTLKYSFEVK